MLLRLLYRLIGVVLQSIVMTLSLRFKDAVVSSLVHHFISSVVCQLNVSVSSTSPVWTVTHDCGCERPDCLFLTLFCLLQSVPVESGPPLRPHRRRKCNSVRKCTSQTLHMPERQPGNGAEPVMDALLTMTPPIQTDVGIVAPPLRSFGPLPPLPSEPC